jgi:D-alanyl-lipoteichoic acid acyltransferase DltB (MBOAT superfamily)
MSYVFDIYRGHQKPVRSFIEYAVFVSFFPLLVAGPIERASHLLPQVQKSRAFNYMQNVEGFRLMLWGLFKKVVVADSLAPTVDAIFGNYQHESGLTLILGAAAFSFQIYGDFSGYSDIALGTAKMFGFELLSNFKFPYFSRDVAEFWRRWHISLSSWFKDYLYIPLGGSREGKWKAIRNTFIIFLVSGFWHGASWNFIAWGFIHACGFLPLLLFNRNRRYSTDVAAQNRYLPTIKELIQMITTFIFVTIAWVFFRSNSINDALGYMNGIFSSSSYNFHFRLNYFIVTICLVFFILDWQFRENNRSILKIDNSLARWTIYIVLLLFVVSNFKLENQSTFIYFQF